jgi:outer membrane protein assembly factor BamB
MTFSNPQVTRRSLLAFAGAVSASGILATSGLAQTPEGTPDSSGEGEPGGTPVPGTPVAGIQPGDTVPAELANAADTDWPVQGRNLAQDRSVKGSSITSETVSGLAEAWTMEIEAPSPFGALVANPIISGDILYLQDANSNVYALHRETGEQQWANNYGEQMPSGGPNGIAVGYGAIVYPVGNGGVVAADMESGDELWRIDITGPRGEGITTAPLIYDNKVWISTVPGSVEAFYEGGMRGVIHVIDMADGRVLWYFDTIVDNLWGNPSVNSGGGFWNPPSVNSDGEMFFAIANAAPYPGTEEYPSGSSRPGDNDYANNVLRIDPETGDLIWHVNITGRDLFDSDNHLTPVVGTVEWEDGYTRELVFASGKHGFVVALDPDTGAQFWRTPVGTHRNAHLQEIPEGEQIDLMPRSGVLTPIAYQDGAVYCAIFENVRSVIPSDDVSAALTEGTGKVVSLDAKNGNIRWDIDLPSGALAGATVVNDLMFTGALDGRVRAYSTADGSLVWSTQTTAGLNALLAISGDYLYVPAGGPLIASEESEEVAEQKAQLIAYKLG